MARDNCYHGYRYLSGVDIIAICYESTLLYPLAYISFLISYVLSFSSSASPPLGLGSVCLSSQCELAKFW